MGENLADVATSARAKLVICVRDALSVYFRKGDVSKSVIFVNQKMILIL